MRVLLRVALDGVWCTAVGVTFTQDRVHSGTHDLAVELADLAFFVSLWLVWEVRQVVALRLQLSNGCLQLRNGSRNVRKLHDVRIWALGHLAQLSQGIVDALVLWEHVRKRCDDAASQRNIAGFHRHVRLGGKSLNHRQERVRGEHRRFVGVCIDDLCHVAAFSLNSR